MGCRYGGRRSARLCCSQSLLFLHGKSVKDPCSAMAFIDSRGHLWFLLTDWFKNHPTQSQQNPRSWVLTSSETQKEESHSERTVPKEMEGPKARHSHLQPGGCSTDCFQESELWSWSQHCRYPHLFNTSAVFKENKVSDSSTYVKLCEYTLRLCVCICLYMGIWIGV